MNKPANIPYYFEWSRQFPHIAAVDLGKNMAIEIAVMAIDARNSDLFFIRLDHLDPIDIKRLKQIILTRDSARYALWDLMSQKTLPNGMNALEFFQQFVKIRTVSGQIVAPGSGQRGLPINAELGYKGPASMGYDIGAANGGPNTKAAVVTEGAEHDVEYVALDEGEEGEVSLSAPVKRKAGRPKKAK